MVRYTHMLEVSIVLWLFGQAEVFFQQKNLCLLLGPGNACELYPA